MHNGIFTTIDQLITHYNLIPQNPQNTNLDPRLQGPGGNLQLTQNERTALIAFLRTLTGTAIYTDERWSNPFDENGNLELIQVVGLTQHSPNPIQVYVYPNPSSEFISLDLKSGRYEVIIFDTRGKIQMKIESELIQNLDISHLARGSYYVLIHDQLSTNNFKSAFIKN